MTDGIPVSLGAGGGSQAKFSFVSRGLLSVPDITIGRADRDPRPGDFVVGRIVELDAHQHLEDPYGRRVRLYTGDLVVGAYGNRYATDYYEGHVQPGPTTHLLTAGGLVGTVTSTHDARSNPTVLQVVGTVVSGEGAMLTLDDLALPIPDPTFPPMGTIVVVGSGMNAGKTTTVVSTIRGLRQAGLKVGAGKVTGSGSGKDRWAYLDAGAFAVCDFLDFGMSSTFGYPLERLEQTMHAIQSHLAHQGADVVVLEIADGILQVETAALLERLNGVADTLIYAAVDAPSAHFGLESLLSRGLPLRAISGLVTRSPLATREIDSPVPVLSAAQLSDGGVVTVLAPAGAAR